MSVVGIASSILSTLSGTQNQQNQQPNPFLQIRSEFKQLGEDLQTGNLAQAQSDFTTLSQNLSSVLQNNTSNTANSANPVVQAFAKLGQDLQSGNLQAAQQDFTTIQQDTSQNTQASGHHHRHHHVESSSNSSSSQQSSSLTQDFSQLANSLQSGNLAAAQSAFATLQNDIQQIGGTSVPATAGSVNVTV